mgnify:CR=1 FL=1|jgi:Predicted metal-binding protein
MNYRIPVSLALLSLLATPGALARPAAGVETVTKPASATGLSAERPLLTVHKHPSCGCCGVWVEHMKRAGFNVVEKNVEGMAAVKASAGVPTSMGSCHTAQVGGYFVEGHVPAADIRRLLRERPDARGIVVPGMPIGSPGMEHPQGIVQPYMVSLILKDGSVRKFNRYP